MALCCGSAVFTICSNQKWLMNWVSKVQNLLITGADLIASVKGGTLQITKHLQMQGKVLKVIHPMELLLNCGVKLNLRGLVQ